MLNLPSFLPLPPVRVGTCWAVATPALLGQHSNSKSITDKWTVPGSEAGKEQKRAGVTSDRSGVREESEGCKA